VKNWFRVGRSALVLASTKTTPSVAWVWIAACSARTRSIPMSAGICTGVPSTVTESFTEYGAGPLKSSGNRSNPALSTYETASRGASHGGGPVLISAGPGGAGPTWQPLTTGSRHSATATTRACLIRSRVSCLVRQRSDGISSHRAM
jgi:hypothetical protein